MNKSYRLIWNETRQCHVPAPESAGSRGRANRGGMVVGAAAALLSLAVPPAWAANVCTTSSTTITTVQGTNDDCELPAGGTLTVGAGGVLNLTDGTNAGLAVSTVRVPGASGAITVGAGGRIQFGTGPHNPAHGGPPSHSNAIDIPAGANLIGGIFNSGEIISYRHNGIGIWNSGVLTGDIVNGAGALLASPHDVIELDFGGRLTGNLINDGTIRSQYWDAIAVGDSSRIDGRIVNRGTIAVNTGGGTSAWDNCGPGRCNIGINIWSNGARVGGLDNSGTIAGYFAGVYVAGGASITGGVVNTGVIRGVNYSILALNNNDLFQVDNFGTLEGAAWIGGNTLNLNGNAARVIGATTAFGGTVNVNGSFTSEGGFLAGTFNVPATGVFGMRHLVQVQDGGFNNAGVVDLANAARAVTGSYSQAVGGALRIGLADAASNYGRLNVSGNATLAPGAVVNVQVAGNPTLASGAVVRGVLTAGGTLTATPADIVVVDNSLIYSFSASNSRDARQLDLVVQADAQPFRNVATTTGNAAATSLANVLDGMLAQGVPASLQATFGALDALPPAQASVAMMQLLPAVQGAGSQAGLIALRSMNKIIQSRIESNQGLSSGAEDPERYMWVRGFGARGDQDDRDGFDGFRSRTGGFVLGLDRPLGARVRGGLAFTFARSHINSNSTAAPSSTEVDTHELVAYASHNLNPVTDINYQLDIGQNRAHSRRDAFGGSVASASYSSVAVHGAAGIGRSMLSGSRGNLTPSLRLDYTQMRVGGYTETGAGPVNLSVASSTFREALVTADLKGTYQAAPQWKLVGNISAGYDLINQRTQTSSSLSGGGPAFTTQGAEVSPWLYRAGLGWIHDDGKGVEYSLRWDVESRPSGYSNQTASARLRLQF
ncbi:MAG: autotransporter domain-containing protein [Rubrivivax sp.]|nr:autotransporter domain-containing protein [Rubrivivax sp.]